MTIFAKLIDSNTIEIAPKNKDGIINYNLNDELLIKDGYKPLISEKAINNSRLYHIIYSEDENNIYEIIEYLETQAEADIRKANSEINIQIEDITKEINEIDLKRIRAICEPSIKDEETGETWLEFYNSQVLQLRVEINKLQERITPNDITNKNLSPLDSREQ
ncbi:hypothetical protein J6O86_02935 [bacterium]|nr:hypothetical protein [bacterium]